MSETFSDSGNTTFLYADDPKREEMQTERLSYRQRTKLETRRKLIAAARKLFASQGYHETRPQDIIKEAGVGYGSFYDNFTDKLDCFFAFCEDATYELQKLVQWHWESERDTPQDFLPVVLRVFFEYSQLHPGVVPAIMMDIRVLSSEGSGGRMRGQEQMIERVQQWQNAGYASKDFDAALLGRVITNSVKLAERMVDDRPQDMEKIIKDLSRLLFKTLAP